MYTSQAGNRLNMLLFSSLVQNNTQVANMRHTPESQQNTVYYLPEKIYELMVREPCALAHHLM